MKTAFNKPLIFTKVFDHYKSPTQSLLFTMLPSTNTRYGSIENITISTEATTIPTSTSLYLTKTYSTTTISNIIKYLTAHFIAQIKETIVDQDETFHAKFEKQLHTLSLQVKEDSNKFSSKLIENEVLTLSSEPTSFYDKFERKSQSKISPSN